MSETTKHPELPKLPEPKLVENVAHRMVETVFLPAFIEDNPIGQDKDPEYGQRLYEQGEKIAKAFLKGDWAVFAGQFISEFIYNRHACEPFEIPRGWIKFRGYDWGFAAPAAMVWLAKEPITGRLYLYREYYEAGSTDPIQAERINDMSGIYERYSFTYADPSVWTKRTTGVEAVSTFDVFLRHGIYMTKADNDQLAKAKRLRTALADIYDGEPGLKVFKTCVNTIMEIEGLMSDPNRPELPMNNQTDHLYDALCYALTGYKAPMVTRDRQRNTVYNSDWENVKGL